MEYDTTEDGRLQYFWPSGLSTSQPNSGLVTTPQLGYTARISGIARYPSLHSARDDAVMAQSPNLFANQTSMITINPVPVWNEVIWEPSSINEAQEALPQIYSSMFPVQSMKAPGVEPAIKLSDGVATSGEPGYIHMDGAKDQLSILTPVRRSPNGTSRQYVYSAVEDSSRSLYVVHGRISTDSPQIQSLTST
jgi:hypothetical protein